MDEAQLVAIVIGIVGVLKMQSPKLTGLLVPLVAVGVALVVAFAHSEGVPSSGAEVYPILKLGVKVGLVAVGGMHVVLYGATKVGDALANRTGPA